MNLSPIGCCALAGTTYDTDRYFEAEKLGFDGVIYLSCGSSTNALAGMYVLPFIN